MKRLLIFLLLLIPALALMSQDRIRLKDGSQIENVRIHQVLEHKIVYEEAGSLHEVLRADVKWILQADQGKQSFETKATNSDPTAEYADNPLAQYDQRLLSAEQGSFFVTPSAIVSLTPSVIGGVELSLGPRISVVQEGGVILASVFHQNNQVSGWTSRSSLRRYLKEPFRFFHRPGRVYIAGEFVYKSTESSFSSQSPASLEVNSDTYVYGYLEEQQRQTFAGNGMLGVQWVWPNGLLLEVWGGAGVQQIQSEVYRETYEYQWQEGEITNFEEEISTFNQISNYPSLVGGFRVGVAL